MQLWDEKALPEADVTYGSVIQVQVQIPPVTDN